MPHIALSQLSYAGLFFLLAGSGIVAPVPEEVTLLTAGYLIAHGVLLPVRTAFIAIIAILIGDSILFLGGKAGFAYATRIHDRFKKLGLENTWIFSPDKPLRAVFFLRFVTGFRMIAPIFAGLNDAPTLLFIATDLAALVLFVPAMLLLGHYFSGDFLPFLGTFELVRHIVFWTILVLVGGSLVHALHPKLHRFLPKKHRPQPHD